MNFYGYGLGMTKMPKHPLKLFGKNIHGRNKDHMIEGKFRIKTKGFKH